jgi:hypothetical protein
VLDGGIFLFAEVYPKKEGKIEKRKKLKEGTTMAIK